MYTYATSAFTSRLFQTSLAPVLAVKYLERRRHGHCMLEVRPQKRRRKLPVTTDALKHASPKLHSKSAVRQLGLVWWAAVNAKAKAEHSFFG